MVPFGKLTFVMHTSWRGFLILGRTCQDMLQVGMLLKFLLLTSQNQFLQIVTWQQFLRDKQFLCIQQQAK